MMRRKIQFLSVLPLLLFSLTANATTEEEIDALFVDYEGAVPGASAVVIQNGEVIYKRAFGLADVENGTPATSATNFRLASLTKQFTAMAVLQLVDTKQLSFEDRLTDLFPGFPRYGERITVRHLLHHTSGLRDYEDLAPTTQSGQLTDEDVLRLLTKKTTSGLFTPGAEWRYSNSGYVLLGLLIARRSGQSYPEFLHRHIFRPLGMRNTLAFVAGGPEIEERAYGYTRQGAQWVRTDQNLTSATLGDGGVYTSIDDLPLWDAALGTSFLVSEELMTLVFQPGKLNNGNATSYGLGWMLDKYRGLRREHHTGSTIGFRTAIARYPEKRFTVAVLVNRAGATPWKIAERIVDIFLFPAATRLGVPPSRISR